MDQLSYTETQSFFPFKFGYLLHSINIIYMSQSGKNLVPDDLMTISKRCENCQKLIFFNCFDYQNQACTCYSFRPLNTQDNLIQRDYAIPILGNTDENLLTFEEQNATCRKRSQINDFIGFQKKGSEQIRNRIRSNFMNVKKGQEKEEEKRQSYLARGFVQQNNVKQKRLSYTSQKNVERNYLKNKIDEKSSFMKNWRNNLMKIQEIPTNESNEANSSEEELEQQNISELFNFKRSNFSANELRKKESAYTTNGKPGLHKVNPNTQQQQKQSQESFKPENKLDFYWRRYAEGIKKREQEQKDFKKDLEEKQNKKKMEKQKELRREGFSIKKREQQKQRHKQFERILELSKESYKNIKDIMARKRRRQSQYYTQVNRFLETTKRMKVFVEGLPNQNSNITEILSQLRQIIEVTERIRQMTEFYDSQRVQSSIFERLKQLRTEVVYKISIELIRGFQTNLNAQFREMMSQEPNQTGFTKQEIEQTFKEKALLSEQDCSICLETITSKIKIRQLQCFHKFHSKCIQIWLQNSKSCPICRKKQTLINNS